MSIISEKSSVSLFAKWFYAIWAIAITTPLIYFPAPSILGGHPWKVELTISLILALAIFTFCLLNRENLFNYSINKNALYWIFAPFGVFIAWSGFSVLWANSTESVIHHTLVWGVYLIFFLFAAKITTEKRLLKISLIAFSLVVGAIAAQCIVEHTFSAQIDEVFGFRFARYAEINAVALPLFLSFVLRFNRKHLFWAICLVSIVWLAILFSMSRGSLLSAIAGLFIFITLRVFTRTSFIERKRLIFTVSGLILITFLTQIPLSSSTSPNATTLNRLTTQNADDPDNSLKGNVRLLFAGVGKVMFEENPIIGVGADNFGLEFNNYRAKFSAKEENKINANQQEALIPERAHNEYLQILAELGLVGSAAFLLFIFGIFRLSYFQIKTYKSFRDNILTHAAFAGIVAFFISSLFSSFSFRLMQNGIVFFFLLALLLRNCFSARKVKDKNPETLLRFSPIAVLAVVLCICLALFSGLKATSQYLVYLAETEPDPGKFSDYFEKAQFLDSANASANYLYGLRLLQQKEYPEASQQLKKGINKGLNSSISYSMLATSQIIGNDNISAAQTLKDGLKVFPYSVLLRVRYAITLKKLGQIDESNQQFLLATSIDAKQAKSWWNFINNGASKANQESFVNKEVVSLDELNPIQGVPVILAERQTLYPEEIVKFNFNK